jgi:integrase/recombinase XerC
MTGRWTPKPRPLPLADLALRSRTDGPTVTLMAGPTSSTVVKRVAPNIWTHGPEAYRFFGRVRGKLASHVFRPDRPMSLTGVKEAYRGWRDAQLLGPSRPVHRGTFAADVTAYLSRVSAMTTYDERERHLNLWIAALGGNRPRGSITATEVDVVLQGWLAAGLAPQTVKLRRGALAHVWSVLDGKHAPNPVRDSRKPPPRPVEARGLTLETVQTILGAMRPSQTKVRLWILATTGLPHRQIGLLKAEHIDWAGQMVQAAPRRKGKGAAGGWRPVPAAAIEALRELDKQKLYGAFSPSTMHRAFRLACAKAGIQTKLTPYDLRHSYGTWLYDATGDLATVARLMGCSLKTAERYTMGAQLAVSQRAVHALQLPAGLGAKVDATAKPRATRKDTP